MPIEFKTKPGLVVYLTAGDPDLATTRDIALAAIDNGADVIELGVPFSDPLADGPVIQRASERAVAKGTRLTDVLRVAKELRAARPSCGLVLFSYLNPVIQMGRARAAYRETIRAAAEGEGKYERKVSGAVAGNFGHAKVRVEPNLTGGGNQFANELNAGTLSESYVAAIMEGVEDALKKGILGGHPIVDVKVSLLSATEHPTDSNELSFKIAASMALQEAVRKAQPTTTETSGMYGFCEAVAEAGVDGVLLTDMIVEEAAEYLDAMHANKLAPVFLAAPTSPDARLKAIAECSQGFVYAISRTGITGTQSHLTSDAADVVTRLKQFTKLPVAVGFGISNAEHVKAVGEFADAAVVGSAIVQLIEKTTPEEAAKAVGRFVAELRA
jgi:tryptophan synthase alpha subunit